MKNTTWLRFLKEHGSRRRAFHLEGSPLGEAFYVPQRGATLVYGETMAGATSIALEVCRVWSKEELVVYVDFQDEVKPERLAGVCLDRFLHLSPTGKSSVLKSAYQIGETYRGRPLFVLDTVSVADGRISREIGQICLQIMSMNPDSTILVADNHLNSTHVWSALVEVRHLKGRYRYSEKVGHTASIRGNLGTLEVYIDYEKGLLSQGYHLARRSKREDARKRGYSADGIQADSFWDFVALYDRSFYSRKV